jgi:hypothetical protein
MRWLILAIGRFVLWLEREVRIGPESALRRHPDYYQRLPREPALKPGSGAFSHGVHARIQCLFAWHREIFTYIRQRLVISRLTTLDSSQLDADRKVSADCCPGSKCLFSRVVFIRAGQSRNIGFWVEAAMQHCRINAS